MIILFLVYLFYWVCTAFFAATFVGAIFALITSSSPQVRWFLPTIGVLAGVFLFSTAIAEGGFRWWQPIPGFLLLWWVARDYRSPGGRHEERNYSDIWSAAVMKGVVVFLGFYTIAFFSFDFHHR